MIPRKKSQHVLSGFIWSTRYRWYQRHSRNLFKASCIYGTGFPRSGSGGEKKEKQRKTALNERGSWRLCWLINEQHTLKSFYSSCTSFAHFLLHVTISGYESSASGACLQGKGYTWKRWLYSLRGNESIYKRPGKAWNTPDGEHDLKNFTIKST